jgi:glycine cleavage system aminomethyltransferase T
MVAVFPSARLKVSPFYQATVAEGMTTASIYNGMIMPTSYGDPEGEYWRLIEGVSQWDVGCERQVQLRGRDAGKLAQILAARDLAKCKHGQGKYVPVCDHRGTIINDPILLKHADDLYWLSIADSDVWLWAKAIVAERRLDVEVSEPDVSPMALQGPKAEDVVAAVMGDWVRGLKYFWFRDAELEGMALTVQRSGWSKQGGFEIYLKDRTQGTRLWNIFKEAGQPWSIGPGAPATAERTESGLVSVGGDTDEHTNPFEVRMEPYVSLDVPDDTLGIQALRQIKAEGPKRHQLGLILEGDTSAPLGFEREPILVGGRQVGMMTNCMWSPRLKANIGYALIAVEQQIGDAVEIARPSGVTAAKLVALPFL